MQDRQTPPVHPTALDPRPAVLLLHGLCANPMELMTLGRALREAGYVVRMPELPGYGVNESLTDARRRPAVTPYREWITMACGHYDALAAHHQRVIVGGLCMGAVLALALAAERPASALLLLSTTFHFDGWNVSPWRRLLPLAYVPPLRQWLRFRERPPYGIKNERLRGWVAEAMRSENVSAAGAAHLPAAALYEASRLIRHVRVRLGKLRAPALVLQSSHDDVTSERSVRDLQQRLGRAPEVHWFHDSYHMLTLDNERVAVAAAARDFLSRKVPVTASVNRPVPARTHQGWTHEQQQHAG
jgi:carboxylesterase